MLKVGMFRRLRMGYKKPSKLYAKFSRIFLDSQSEMVDTSIGKEGNK